MTATKEYAGKILISVTDGKNLGEVKDVYFDPEASKMVAAHLGKSGLINRKSLLVDLSHVKLFGLDAWLVDASDIVIAKDDAPGTESYLIGDDLRGRDIQTDGGTKLGTVGDILVDEKHNVIGFALSKVQVQGPVAEAKAIARAAITSLGNQQEPMIAVLEQAERLKV